MDPRSARRNEVSQEVLLPPFLSRKGGGRAVGPPSLQPLRTQGRFKACSHGHEKREAKRSFTGSSFASFSFKKRRRAGRWPALFAASQKPRKAQGLFPWTREARGETKFRTKFFWFLFFQEKELSGSRPGGPPAPPPSPPGRRRGPRPRPRRRWRAPTGWRRGR